MREFIPGKLYNIPEEQYSKLANIGYWESCAHDADPKKHNIVIMLHSTDVLLALKSTIAPAKLCWDPLENLHGWNFLLGDRVVWIDGCAKVTDLLEEMVKK